MPAASDEKIIPPGHETSTRYLPAAGNPSPLSHGVYKRRLRECCAVYPGRHTTGTTLRARRRPPARAPALRAQLAGSAQKCGPRGSRPRLPALHPCSMRTTVAWCKQPHKQIHLYLRALDSIRSYHTRFRICPTRPVIALRHAGNGTPVSMARWRAKSIRRTLPEWGPYSARRPDPQQARLENGVAMPTRYIAGPLTALDGLPASEVRGGEHNPSSGLRMRPPASRQEPVRLRIFCTLQYSLHNVTL